MRIGDTEHADVAWRPGPTPSPPVARLARSARRVAGPVLAAAALVLPVLTADDAVSVFGSRVVQVAAEQERVEVGTLFGSVAVVVPADAQVSTAGWIVFGSVDCGSACHGSGSRPSSAIAVTEAQCTKGCRGVGAGTGQDRPVQGEFYTAQFQPQVEAIRGTVIHELRHAASINHEGKTADMVTDADKGFQDASTTVIPLSQGTQETRRGHDGLAGS